MDKGKVRSVKSVIEIVVVVVNLDWGKLTFVDDVGGVEGTDVEAFLKATKRQREPDCKAYIL